MERQPELEQLQGLTVKIVDKALSLAPWMAYAAAPTSWVVGTGCNVSCDEHAM